MGKEKIRKFVAAVDIRHLHLYKASSGALFIQYNQGHQIPKGGRHVKPMRFSSVGYGAGLFFKVISLMLKLYWNGMLQTVHESQAISEILALALLMLFKRCKLCLHFLTLYLLLFSSYY